MAAAQKIGEKMNKAAAQQQAAHGGRQENAQKGFHVGKVNFPQR